MVLSRYGIRRSQERIAFELAITRTGTCPAELGTYLLDEGFHVVLYFWQLGIKPKFLGARGSTLHHALRSSLNASAGKKLCTYWDMDRRFLMRFIAAGGTLRLEPIQPHHLAAAFAHRQSVILSYDSRLLGRYGSENAGHFVVPLRFARHSDGRTQLVFLNPQSGRPQRSYLDRIMHACHLWEGCGMIIHPRSADISCS